MLTKTAFALVVFSATLFGQSDGTQTATNKSNAGGHMPVEISMTGGTVGPGNQVTYRVVLAGSPTQDQDVTITTSNSSAYSSIPDKVVVPANEDNVSFNATLSSSLPGAWSIYASAEGVTVTATSISIARK